jgi:hypothetical protein
VQHWSFTVQACPAPVQLLVWQVPVVDPGGMEHEYPVQQSAVDVHDEPWGWHATGAWQVRLPGSPMQRSEQQSVFVLQVAPLALQTPASGVPASPEPASGVPASLPGGGFGWQA